MEKNTIVGIVVLAILIVGAVFVSGNYLQKDNVETNNIQSVAEKPAACGCGCNGDCGGSCAVKECKCGR